jgi:hypothetical protein
LCQEKSGNPAPPCVVKKVFLSFSLFWREREREEKKLEDEDNTFSYLANAFAAEEKGCQIFLGTTFQNG